MYLFTAVKFINDELCERMFLILCVTRDTRMYIFHDIDAENERHKWPDNTAIKWDQLNQNFLDRDMH